METPVWYIAIDNKPTGPFTVRDLDVQFRTNELASNACVWREGLTEWKKIFEEPELRELFQASTSEVVAETKVEKNDSSSDASDVEEIDSEFCYYNKEEKVYKIFQDGKWLS